MKTQSPSKKVAMVVHKPGSTVVQVMQRAMGSAERAFTDIAKLVANEKLSTGALAETYSIIDKQWRKVLEDIRAHARERLLAKVQEEGEQLENAKQLDVTFGQVGTFRVQKTEYRSKLPAEEQLTELLLSKGLTKQAGFDQVITYEVSEAKLAALVESGKVTRAELDACRKTLAPQLKLEKL